MRVLPIAILMLIALPSLALGQTDVIIVRSDLPYEFAIAQGYSHLSGVPIVATAPDTLGEGKKELLKGYLDRGYRHAVILGGEVAISMEVQSSLDKMGFITRRIAEANRYGTSSTFAREFYGQSEGAVLVSGEDVDDLLLAERISSAKGYPLLFTREEALPPAVADALMRMGVEKVYLFEEEVSKEVLNALEDYELVGAREAEFEAGERKPYTLFLLVALVGALVGGGLGYYLKVEKKERVPMGLLTEDEERLIKAIREGGGTITQDRLPRMTDFSRPKITRLVSELQARGILRKESKGRTNEIKLIKEFD